ncbi:MAG: hypothetical protein HKN33_14660 [Pyrinomonadaceae bacterium]|nr:hypothetical protein [Pyrinomonadaceae bacterium]
MIIAQIIVWTALIYLVIGTLFSLYFVTAKIAEFDDSAKGAGIGFRLVIFFGAIPFWVFLLSRMISGTTGVAETNEHRRSAGGDK